MSEENKELQEEETVNEDHITSSEVSPDTEISDETSEETTETENETESPSETLSDEDKEDEQDEEVSDDNDDNEPVINADKKDRKKTDRGPRFRAPIIIAACVFLCTILFFAGWKCFFDTSIEGDWAVEVTSSKGEKVFGYTFSFDNDHVFRMRSEGTSLVGRYYFDNRKKADGTTEPIFSIYLTSMGGSYMSADFGYSFSGNVFTGRVLKLTDYTGIFLPSDTSESDKEEVKKKKALTGFIEEDGVTYYTWDFLSTDYKNEIKYYDDFKTDDAILGSWKYTEKDTGYSYTLTFNKDGSFEQYSYESEVVGAYSYSDGKIDLRYYNLGGALSESRLTASVSDDKLTFNGLSYKRTADKNDYKTGIK